MKIKVPKLFDRRTPEAEQLRTSTLYLAKKRLAREGIYTVNSKHRTLGMILEELVYVTCETGFWKYSINALAEKFDVTRQTISNIIKKLIKAGVITKFTSLLGNKMDKAIFVMLDHPNVMAIRDFLNNVTLFTSEVAQQLAFQFTPCFASGTRRKSSQFNAKWKKIVSSCSSVFSDSSLTSNINDQQPSFLEQKSKTDAEKWADSWSA